MIYNFVRKMDNNENVRYEKQRKYKKSYDSFSLGSISISSGELELFDALERKKNHRLGKKIPQSVDFWKEENRKTSLSDSRSFQGIYGSFEEEKREYHEKNQLFLQKLAHQNPNQVRNKTTLRRDCPKAIYLSHPPTTGLSHRRLESIDNDDWEDSNSDPKSPENDYNSIVDDFNNRNNSRNHDYHEPEANDYIARKKRRDEKHCPYEIRSRDGSSDTPPTDEISFEIQDFSDSYFDDEEDYYQYSQEHGSHSQKKKRKKRKKKRKNFEVRSFHNPPIIYRQRN